MTSDQETRNIKRPGRIVSAFRVLMGTKTTPAQLAADWAEWELVLTGVLDRFGALLARQAKAEKRKVQQQLELAPPDIPGSALSSKADLYARANRLRGHNAHVKVAPNGGLDVVIPPQNFDTSEENP